MQLDSLWQKSGRLGPKGTPGPTEARQLLSHVGGAGGFACVADRRRLLPQAVGGAALIKQFWTVSHWILFPVLEEELGPLRERYQLRAPACTLLELEGWGMRRGRGRGRPPADRLAVLRDLLAKSCLNLSTPRQWLDLPRTDATRRRLCGWPNWRQVPSEAVFSRAFAELAGSGGLEQGRKELIERGYGGRLAGHAIRDATAIEVREKPERKPPTAPPKRRRGRPRKDEPPAPKPRLERPPEMSLPEMLAELPTACDRGCKMGTDGRQHRWKGYKLHGDLSASQVPLSGVLTSASTHDSPVAIPLATMRAQRVTACYEMMDAGYHSEHLQAYGERLGHVALIPDVERQNKPAVPMAPAQKRRDGLTPPPGWRTDPHRPHQLAGGEFRKRLGMLNSHLHGSLIRP